MNWKMPFAPAPDWARGFMPLSAQAWARPSARPCSGGRSEIQRVALRRINGMNSGDEHAGGSEDAEAEPALAEIISNSARILAHFIEQHLEFDAGALVGTARV